MQHDNNNSGTLGKNERRDKGTQPEYNGKCEIEGKLYWISAWVRLGTGGKKFFSLKFKPQDAQWKDEKKKPSNDDAMARARMDAELDEDLPF